MTGARHPLRDGELNLPPERERHGRVSRCLRALSPSPVNAAGIKRAQPQGATAVASPPSPSKPPPPPPRHRALPVLFSS